MGLDSPNIRKIIHWGPPTDTELYVQETGRDGNYSKAILYYSSRDISKSSHVQESMKAFCLNTTECRRSMLMNQFEQSPSFERPKVLHLCCDICMQVCKCHDCETLPASAMTTFENFVDDLPVSSSPKLTVEKRQKVHQALFELRRSWCESSGTAYLLVGEEVCTGLTNGAINYILNNFYGITTEEQLSELGIASCSYCQQVFSLISSLK